MGGKAQLHRFGFWPHLFSHRAVDDCQATLEILSRPLPRSGRTGFDHLLSQAFEPLYRVKAVRAPYEAKNVLKARDTVGMMVAQAT